LIAAQHRDGSAYRAARYGLDRAATQPAVAGLGGVLLPGSSEQELSSAGSLHDPSATPVVVPQTQGWESRLRTLPGRVLLCSRGPRAAWNPVPRPFRGQTHEVLSESRMREIRMAGSMSGDWKRKPIKGLNAPVLDSTWRSLRDSNPCTGLESATPEECAFLLIG
jgi:hypothetical protein